MSQRMKALVLDKYSSLQMHAVPVPDISDGDILIKVKRAGICGSELSGYAGINTQRKPPLIMGHEFSGTVVRAGAGVTNVRVGDRVTVNPLVSCGKCKFCRSGSSHLCRKRELIGAQRPGGFAEYVAAPADQAYALPDHVSFQEGALTEPLACAVHVVEMLNMRPSSRLLIMGAGTIGLFVLQIAKIYGIQRISVFDINDRRLDIARQLGGDAYSDKEVLTDWQREEAFEGAVDAVGLDATRVQCIRSVCPGSTVVLSGLHDEESNMSVNWMIRNEIRLFGAFAYTSEDFENALFMIQKGDIRLLPWVRETPLAQGMDCFETLLHDAGGIAKILLQP